MCVEVLRRSCLAMLYAKSDQNWKNKRILWFATLPTAKRNCSISRMRFWGPAAAAFSLSVLLSFVAVITSVSWMMLESYTVTEVSVYQLKRIWITQSIVILRMVSLVWCLCFTCVSHLLHVLCRLLNEAQGSLLDDEHLLITLQTSKTTSQDIKEQLDTSEETEEQIDAAREASTLFSVGEHIFIRLIII